MCQKNMFVLKSKNRKGGNSATIFNGVVLFGYFIGLRIAYYTVSTRVFSKALNY